MSVQASITISFSIIKGRVSPIEIINTLLSKGWTFNDHGGITYLPLGENEGFDWNFQEKISGDLIMEIIKEKEQRQEVIGVAMTWHNTNTGGLFMFREDNQLSILVNINRKTFPDSGGLEITDVNWYLSRLLPVFSKNNLFVEFFSFEEFA